ncbi:hypothetical protein DFR86_03750 [Acidianus sulfidivorans JP7]|uniref:IS1 family transposase n=1 Tax=Acidianus sulfidivorans JP7 TaxID=619593 RepID=A0A2U9IL58_9CREN|nr:hypothetical protein [Acidianus sulfidivorans]AWR96756.1 hypothetical protein DFR86_03750 [Acidianus sulfidivorans JP7]
MRRIIRNITCPNCGSNYVVKVGKIKGKQAYLCKDCHRKFVESAKHWYPKWIKDEAVQMYLKGINPHYISEVLEVPYHTTLMWIKRYIELQEKINQLNNERNSKTN